MNHENPKQQTYENSNGDKKDAFDLSPENPIKNLKLKEESSLKPDSEENNQKRIEEIKNNLRKAFEPATFNESLVLEKLKEASDIIYDMDALPLSVDSTYQVLSEWLTTQCEEAINAFFKKARDGNAEERLRYSAALMRLGMVADEKVFDAALKQNLTNRHAIEELYKKARKENKLPDERKLTTKETFEQIGKILLDKIKSFFKK